MQLTDLRSTMADTVYYTIRLQEPENQLAE